MMPVPSGTGLTGNVRLDHITVHPSNVHRATAHGPPRIIQATHLQSIEDGGLNLVWP